MTVVFTNARDCFLHLPRRLVAQLHLLQVTRRPWDTWVGHGRGLPGTLTATGPLGGRSGLVQAVLNRLDQGLTRPDILTQSSLGFGDL